MANRTIVSALLLGLSLGALTACPKKAEPTVEASVLDAAVTVLVPPDTDAAVAQFDAGAAPVVAAHPATAAVVDRGAAIVDSGVAVVDSGGAAAAVAEPTPAASTPPPGECCCEMAGQPLASLGQSECTKAKHGQCVKKQRCAAAALKAADGTKNCCCNVNGTKSIMGQSDCARGGQGQCVKMRDCKAR